jgi:hypothetical protein
MHATGWHPQGGIVEAKVAVRIFRMDFSPEDG